MISLAVTAFREMSEAQLFGRRLQRCIQSAQEHDAVSEIVIVDDGSDHFDKLEALLRDQAKVKLYRNQSRMGVFTNKVEAVLSATGEWVITCDSDNAMGRQYIDQVVAMEKNAEVWYCPSFARPRFDYRRLVGEYDLRNLGSMLALPMAQCAINTGNQVVHRKSFARVFGKYRQVRRFDLLMPNYMEIPEAERLKEGWWLGYGACDSFLLNLDWLLAGGRIKFMVGLEYDHYVCDSEPMRGNEGSDEYGSNYARAGEEKSLLNARLVELVQAGKFREAQNHA